MPLMHEYKHEIWIFAEHPKYVITALWCFYWHFMQQTWWGGLLRWLQVFNAPCCLTVRLFTLQLKCHQWAAGPEVARMRRGRLEPHITHWVSESGCSSCLRIYESSSCCAVQSWQIYDRALISGRRFFPTFHHRCLSLIYSSATSCDV